MKTKWKLIEKSMYGRMAVNIYINQNKRYKLHFIKYNFNQYYKNIPQFIVARSI